MHGHPNIKQAQFFASLGHTNREEVEKTKNQAYLLSKEITRIPRVFQWFEI
jgi:hypothetical protein